MEEIKTHCWPWVHPFLGGNHEDHPNNVQSDQNLHPGAKRSSPRAKVDARKTRKTLFCQTRILNRRSRGNLVVPGSLAGQVLLTYPCPVGVRAVEFPLPAPPFSDARLP